MIDKKDQTIAFQDETLKRQEKQLGEWKQTIASLQEAFAWHKSQIESLNKTKDYLSGEIDQLRLKLESDEEALAWRASQVEEFERVVASKDEALAWRASQVESLERQLQDLSRHLEAVERDLTGRLATTTQELEAIEASRGWQFILRIRSIRASLLRIVGRK